ncbi:cyclin-dependent kinase inhibitor 1C-like [Oppia nitens]|uniref:cyclin-dependent kinase inhibitor 1C-like n=1 Tax=Oppia nitens TaxID=1686743 RepID=UPI0023DAAC6C|nr:cyclin-dependent kinase inhibitor 1C-like [Oppia nitens]XP_054160733.1 cyclin-dependent kinase inhibitor 1C-like [Oppia nitens]XP_054160734.1 cyclin-dependent kinase inhibitor 1C-like [Oppia nitens]XP_054160735.1 cyclin-dependent kinase inhibitor 1C-like [Oppia nitens]
MTRCTLMIPPYRTVSAMAFRDIGGNGPPPRDTNAQPSNERVQSVRRRLFGDIDHQQTHRDLQQQLRQCEDEDRNRYNFDFSSEQPINSPESRYQWSHINNNLNLQSDNTFDTKLKKFSTNICKNNDQSSTIESHQSAISPIPTPTPAPEPVPRPETSATIHSSVSTDTTVDSTSAMIASDSQPKPSSSSNEKPTGAGLTPKIVNQLKQTQITDYFVDRKSQRKRSSAQVMSHKESDIETQDFKRHRPECTTTALTSHADKPSGSESDSTP